MQDKIYFFDDIDNVDDKFLSLMYSILPNSRKEKVDKCYYSLDKKIKIIEYFLIKTQLKLYAGQDFRYTKKGKPYLKGNKNFNISHSDKALVVAFSDDKIGIDIQKKIKFDDDLLKYIANKKEYYDVISSNDRDLAITKLWTKKESLIKYKGITIATNLKTLLRNKEKYNFDFFYEKDYVICICKQK